MVIIQDKKERYKFYLIFLFLLVMIPSVSSVPVPKYSTGQSFEEGFVLDFPLIETHKVNTDIEIAIHIYNISTGSLVSPSDASCIMHFYNSSGAHLFEDYELMEHGEHFMAEINGGNISTVGSYGWSVHCNSSRIGGYVSKVFKITKTGAAIKDNVSPIGSIILLPMILSILLLVGAAILNPKQHGVLKIFLFLLSIVPFFISMHMGVLTLVEFYNFEVLENLVGNTVYWVTLLFGALISYFIIYTFYQLVHEAAQKRKERLEL